jgi:hypothetical protein
MTSPIQTFKDNIRPANLMLQVYSLLNTDDQLVSDGEMIDALRDMVQATIEEDLLLVYNEIFLGLVREAANIPRSTLRRGTLAHLLRQAVVASCTGLDTYLPALLRTNLPVVIRAVGRDFIPKDDGGVREYFQDLTFKLDELLRLLDDPNVSDYISNKILNLTNFAYLSSHKGVHVTVRLLGVNKPWEQIANHLGRDKKELMSVLNETVRRRNDIIHRADRNQDNPDDDPQEITFAWAKQSVDTIEHICLALDAIVAERMHEMQAVVDGR